MSAKAVIPTHDLKDIFCGLSKGKVGFNLGIPPSPAQVAHHCLGLLSPVLVRTEVQLSGSRVFVIGQQLGGKRAQL